ncbi:hypothetical protein PsorP6_003947 [Peronosclerospora sorghi]|uniref:Uncharacterized protein n=1 Tax=Peronosclerospora sorghi TaxID=230839 RepID=A0ACC0VME3_9STRA|nr:hypothetical protein PsorP6_003947 [Peronosclerospora sorghi]
MGQQFGFLVRNYCIMKEEMLRALQRVADMLVGNFTTSFQNELRFMAEAAGSSYANAMKMQRIPMAQAVKHSAGAVARL